MPSVQSTRRYTREGFGAHFHALPRPVYRSWGFPRPATTTTSTCPRTRSWLTKVYTGHDAIVLQSIAPHQQELIELLRANRDPYLSSHQKEQVIQAIRAWTVQYKHLAVWKPELLPGSWAMLWSDTESVFGERNLLQVSRRLLPAQSVVVTDLHQSLGIYQGRFAQHWHVTFAKQCRAIWTMEAEISAMYPPITSVSPTNLAQPLRLRLLFQDVSLQTLSGTFVAWRDLLQVRHLPDGQWQGSFIHPFTCVVEHWYIDPLFRITSDLWGLHVLYRIDRPEDSPYTFFYPDQMS